MGVAKPGKGGGGEVRAKSPPQLLTEPEIPAERRRERQRKRDTYRDRELATHSQKEEGVHTLGYGTPSKYTQWARVSNAVNQAHLCCLFYPCLCSQPPLSAASRPPNLPLLPTEFEEGLLDRCPAPGTHPALVEGRRSSVKVEAEASRQ